jgi:hypothetical protein
VSVDRSTQRLLAWYPASWRARYGEELAALILDMTDGRRLSWRLRADIAAAGTRERLRGVGDARSGGRLVLWAWAIFIIAGAIVVKTSEHWQTTLPVGGHWIAAAAFSALTFLAIATALLVLAGIAVTIPSLIAFLQTGGWPKIRAWILAAAALTAALVAATAALAAWAHGLTHAARNGHDTLYTTAFLIWAALAALTLLAWTKAATTTADRLTLTPTTLHLHARLAPVITVAMTLMTATTVMVWVAVAVAAPAGIRPSAGAAPIVPSDTPQAFAILAAAGLMTFATALAGAGTRRAHSA